MTTVTTLFNERTHNRITESLPNWYKDSGAALSVKQMVKLLNQLILKDIDNLQREVTLKREDGILASAPLFLKELKIFYALFNPKSVMGAEFFQCVDADEKIEVVLNLVDPTRYDDKCRIPLVVLTVHVMRNETCTCFRAVSVLEDGTVCSVLPIETRLTDLPTPAQE